MAESIVVGSKPALKRLFWSSPKVGSGSGAAGQPFHIADVGPHFSRIGVPRSLTGQHRIFADRGKPIQGDPFADNEKHILPNKKKSAAHAGHRFQCGI